MTKLTLGAVLRAWRHRTDPADLGLPGAEAERRTPGLRRAELARLAGVSPEYVKRLEQDRARPSIDVVRSLARALRATHDEYGMLARLAGHTLPPGGTVPRQITEGVQRLAARLGDVPLAVYDATWTLLTANRAWAALLGDPAALTGRDRNVLWQIFTSENIQVRMTDWERHERSLVADLRDATHRYPDDAELNDLVGALLATGGRFARLWDQPAVARHGGQRKTVSNPLVGDVTLDCDVLTVHDVDLRLVILTVTPDTTDAVKLATLTGRHQPIVPGPPLNGPAMPEVIQPP
ncbi:helix-turn-helix domain-containing protein [Actinoplanes sp. LDG1-06]|uniref:Helix-turn-helix domain-containing protein n=1 Tax=Paractinoplanes ovalisporus TaxID=2810368 RepID=A0ABS2AHM5_9ACTN|nr:helix-turn-helix domain-containing protein [Actinoplanes ovalisporus]MBM2619329.1 helix-turn-helix domain-containing protein [Actinoplanes ovalisporus]